MASRMLVLPAPFSPVMTMAFEAPCAPAGPGASDFCLVWDGTAASAVEHLEGHGVTLVAGPVDRQGAAGIGSSVYCHDPDGNLVELMSYAEAG